MEEYSRELFARLRTHILEAIEWTGTPDDAQIRAQIDEALAAEEQVRRMPAKLRIRLGRDLFDSLRRFDAITELLEDGSLSTYSYTIQKSLQKPSQRLDI